MLEYGLTTTKTDAKVLAYRKDHPPVFKYDELLLKTYCEKRKVKRNYEAKIVFINEIIETDYEN